MARVADSPATISEMLDCVPLRNAAVTTERGADGALVLRVPVEPRWFMQPPVSWILPFRRERAVALDPLGEEIWNHCDGGHSVEHIIEHFAEHHHLSFHEARLSVAQFLRGLTERGLVAVAFDIEEREEA
jgi:hypothetical protein